MTANSSGEPNSQLYLRPAGTSARSKKNCSEQNKEPRKGPLRYPSLRQVIIRNCSFSATFAARVS
jgi:hypothetical protein